MGKAVSETARVNGAGEPEPIGARGETEGQAPLPRSWAELYPPRPKPQGVDYGFLSARGEPVASTRENLLHLARTRSLPSLAWSPETAEMVPPWEVPFILEALRDEMARRGRRELRLAMGALGALVLGSWLLAPRSVAVVLTIVGMFLLLLIGTKRRRVRQAQRLSAEELSRRFDALVEQRAEMAQPIPATRAIGNAILAAGIVQAFALGASVDAGALRLDAVAAGEWWRLLTAPVLHGGIFHFWMNYAALESLGRTMETRGPPALVPIVFLVSALAGGAASLALPPDVASVGASGGLMGMFGFLAVMAYRRKRHLPEGFLKALLINIGLIALMGIVAYRFIDNAAHGGGLLAGLVVGLLAIPHGDRVPAWTGGRALALAGRAALALVWMGAVLAILVTLGARPGG
jgi:membrane associated rhomboid family serine protease